MIKMNFKTLKLLGGVVLGLVAAGNTLLAKKVAIGQYQIGELHMPVFEHLQNSMEKHNIEYVSSNIPDVVMNACITRILLVRNSASEVKAYLAVNDAILSYAAEYNSAKGKAHNERLEAKYDTSIAKALSDNQISRDRQEAMLDVINEDEYYCGLKETHETSSIEALVAMPLYGQEDKQQANQTAETAVVSLESKETKTSNIALLRGVSKPRL